MITNWRRFHCDRCGATIERAVAYQSSQPARTHTIPKTVAKIRGEGWVAFQGGKPREWFTYCPECRKEYEEKNLVFWPEGAVGDGRES